MRSRTGRIFSGSSCPFLPPQDSIRKKRSRLHTPHTSSSGQANHAVSGGTFHNQVRKGTRGACAPSLSGIWVSGPQKASQTTKQNPVGAQNDVFCLPAPPESRFAALRLSKWGLDQACPRQGVNGLFQAAKRKARGYGRLSTIRTLIFLIAGRLDFSQINPYVAREPT